MLQGVKPGIGAGTLCQGFHVQIDVPIGPRIRVDRNFGTNHTAYHTGVFLRLPQDMGADATSMVVMRSVKTAVELCLSEHLADGKFFVQPWQVSRLDHGKLDAHWHKLQAKFIENAVIHYSFRLSQV